MFVFNEVLFINDIKHRKTYSIDNGKVSVQDEPNLLMILIQEFIGSRLRIRPLLSIIMIFTL